VFGRLFPVGFGLVEGRNIIEGPIAVISKEMILPPVPVQVTTPRSFLVV